MCSHFVQILTIATVLFSAFPALAQKPNYVLERQEPIISEPYSNEYPGIRETSSISAGSGTFEYSGRGERETVDRWNLIANVTFEAPPERIIPGEKFTRTASGSFSGFADSTSRGAQLVYYIERGGKVENNVLNFSSSEFKDIDGNKRKGVDKQEITAAFSISKDASNNLKIRVAFGSTGKATILYTYKKVGGETVDVPADEDPCPYPGEFEQLRNKYNTLERIKNTPELFSLDVRYDQHPFEICIKDGKATLKAEAEMWQEMAGAASKILTAYVGLAAPTGTAGALVSGKAVSNISAEAGKVSAQAFRETAVSRAKAAGQFTFHQIRDISRDSKVIENFSNATISTALKNAEPATLATSAFTAKIQGLLNGGPLTVPANEGLEIYNQLLISAEVVRANNGAMYCKLLESQYAVASELRALARRAVADSENTCATKFLTKNRAEISEMIGKLRHDLTFAGDGGYISKFGTNWTINSVYNNLECAKTHRVLGTKFRTKF